MVQFHLSSLLTFYCEYIFKYNPESAIFFWEKIFGPFFHWFFSVLFLNFLTQDPAWSCSLPGPIITLYIFWESYIVKRGSASFLWNGEAMEPEVIPAILSKTREDLMRRVALVRGLVKEIQIDVMDGLFVPNKTVGLEDLVSLPGLDGTIRYEFHWMVKDPARWIGKMKGPHMHLVHIETITKESFSKVLAAVKESGGDLGLAINPDSSLEALLPYISKAKRVLVMTVRPGFSGQTYMYEMAAKIRKLRKLYPKLDIEVDGGVNLDTIAHAYSNGANVLAAASAIFAQADIKDAIASLKKRAIAKVAP
jgi:ribulose-phosphate 3-epimerase